MTPTGRKTPAPAPALPPTRDPHEVSPPDAQPPVYGAPPPPAPQAPPPPKYDEFERWLLDAVLVVAAALALGFLRRYLRAFLVLALFAACRPPAVCPRTEPPALQLLVAAHADLNADERGAAWPVQLRVFTLERPAPERLELPALLADPAAALGAAPLAAHDFTVFPGQRSRFAIPAPAEGTTLLAVGLVRRPVGQAWHTAAAVPGPAPRTCADPCLYLALARGDVEGGRFPPAGFPTRDFPTACAPLVRPQGDRR